MLQKGEPMDDLISRQAAIDALYSVDEYNSRSVKAIKQLQPIQPKREERKIGEWIYDWGDWDFETCKCSECGNHMTAPIGERYSFCPNCGADMRGEQE